MSKLERLRLEVADKGIIPRREGSDGIPTELFNLKVKELEQLLEEPALAAEYTQIARIRNKKRKKHISAKKKVYDSKYGGISGLTERLAILLQGAKVTCLGYFASDAHFISVTGNGRWKKGYVFEVDGEKLLLSNEEALHASLEYSIPLLAMQYDDTDIYLLIYNSRNALHGDKI